MEENDVMNNAAVDRLIEVLCDLYQIKASQNVDNPTLDLIIRKNEIKIKSYNMNINLDDLKLRN